MATIMLPIGTEIHCGLLATVRGSDILNILAVLADLWDWQVNARFGKQHLYQMLTINHYL